MQEALDTPRLTLGDFAQVLGVERATVEKYRLLPGEDRTLYRVPARARLRLAAYLEAHARRLLALAEELRATADDPE